MAHLIRCLVIISLLLSVILCQEEDEVQCEFRRGGMNCDCKYSDDSLRLPSLDGSVRFISVKNCNDFHVPFDSMRQLDSLKEIKFENIARLQMSEYSLNFSIHRPSISFEIYNTTVPNLPSHFIKGSLDQLVIENSHIEKISIFALTGLRNNSRCLMMICDIIIKNSTIDSIELEAFRKLTIHNLEIINTNFVGNLVSRTFYDCYIEEINIEHSYFSRLLPSALALRDVHRFTIFNTTFGTIDGEAFVMNISDRVTFDNNEIHMLRNGAFRGITKHAKTATQRTDEVTFDFRNNHADFFDLDEEFSFCPELRLNLQRFTLRDPQNCDSVNRMSEKTFYSLNSNSILIRTDEDHHEFETISYHNDKCKNESMFWPIIIIIAAIIAILLIVITVLVIVYYNRSKKKLEIIMPEPRTYRQTQIVMQVENCGLLKTDF